MDKRLKESARRRLEAETASLIVWRTAWISTFSSVTYSAVIQYR
jgi:hypothetical protein